MKSLEITTVKTCTVNCYPFCPQLKFRDSYGAQASVLSLEDFKKALSNVPKEIRIRFSGFSEPFLNKDAVNMMEWASQQGYEIEIFTTLLGCKPEYIERIAGLNVKRFVLHLPDPNNIAHLPITETYKDTLISCITKLQINSFVAMNNQFRSHGRAGNSYDAPRLHVKGFFHCDLLSETEFVMLPNCDVVLCCMDWTLRHRLGNMLSMRYQDIEKSEMFKAIRGNQWRLDGNVLCRSCSWATPLPVQFGYDAKSAVGTFLNRLYGRSYFPKELR